MDAIESKVFVPRPLAEQLAMEAEERAASITFEDLIEHDDPEAVWARARLEAFARHLREEWARTDPSIHEDGAAILAEDAEFAADGLVLELNEIWRDPNAEAEDGEAFMAAVEAFKARTA